MASRSTILLGILLSLVDLGKAGKHSKLMMKFTQTFGRAIMFCQIQMEFPDDILIKIRHFWHDDYNGKPEEMACVIQCALKRLKLTDKEGNLVPNHAIAFAKANGADDDTVNWLLEAVTKDCEPSPNMLHVPEHCLKAIVAAKCLRNAIRKTHRDWLKEVDTDTEKAIE